MVSSRLMASYSLGLFPLLGMLKKAASLRRSGFAQAGRHFAVFPYSMYAPLVKMAAAFPSTLLRTGLDRPFGKTQGMLF